MVCYVHCCVVVCCVAFFFDISYNFEPNIFLALFPLFASQGFHFDLGFSTEVVGQWLCWGFVCGVFPVHEPHLTIVLLGLVTEMLEMSRRDSGTIEKSSR